MQDIRFMLEDLNQESFPNYAGYYSSLFSHSRADKRPSLI